MRRTAAGVAAAAATKPTGIETSTTTTPRGSISGGGAGEAKEEGGLSLRIIPRVSVFGTIWWFYTWPIRAITTCLIPNPKTQRRLYPLSFIMCIAFIGFNSYLIFWMIVVIGDTFGIPEVVMGLTILCWGSCLPEAIACIIIIRQGRCGWMELCTGINLFICLQEVAALECPIPLDRIQWQFYSPWECRG